MHIMYHEGLHGHTIVNIILHTGYIRKILLPWKPKKPLYGTVLLYLFVHVDYIQATVPAALAPEGRGFSVIIC